MDLLALLKNRGKKKNNIYLSWHILFKNNMIVNRLSTFFLIFDKIYQMKVVLSLFFVIASFCSLQAQYKIVFDIAGKDTADQSALFRQLKNVLTLAPDAKIEVVYHGQAIAGLVQGQSFFSEKVKEFHQKGVTFAACNNSLKRIQVDPSQVLSDAVVVPMAILELAKKQEEGWSYIIVGH
jgi:intracellular sulfur oxidation DsrE/DsrF family protein